MPSPTPTLETPRLHLTPIQLGHAAALQRHFAHWHIIRHLSTQVPWPYPPDGVETFLRDLLLPKIEAGKAHAWVLIPRDAQGEPGPEPVGMLEWRCDPEATDHRGFWLARTHQGQGLMTEAVTAFQDWVFFELGVPRLIVHSAVRNDASRRVKEKTGARPVAEVELSHHEGITATTRWEITRASWAAARGVTLDDG